MIIDKIVIKQKIGYPVEIISSDLYIINNINIIKYSNIIKNNLIEYDVRKEVNFDNNNKYYTKNINNIYPEIEINETMFDILILVIEVKSQNNQTRFIKIKTNDYNRIINIS
jgi:hypothetical protein